ncbi:MAG: hypothetical protein EHM42_07280 [Planctomycetaceae bacterium]|nr:MAG: hypothetical protein EHM42_07280 [Planctomycetaceae bacterium]
MFGRFVCAVVLVMAVAMAGTRSEKRNRELARQISLQHYRLKVLERDRAQARLRAESQGAPARVLDRVVPRAAGNET